MEPEERFATFFAAKGLRVSDERRVVLRVALAKSGVFTAESIVEQFSLMSRSTIYRTLKMMVEAGLLESAGDLDTFEAAGSGNRPSRF